MELKEASVTFGIPEDVIAKMEREGLICLPLDDAGVKALAVLARLWGQSWFVGRSLKSIRHIKDRTMLLLFPEYSKIDRYILNTFLNEQNMKNPPTEVLKYRVKRAFGVHVGAERVRQLRRMACDIKQKKKKLILGKLILTYADLLGV